MTLVFSYGESALKKFGTVTEQAYGAVTAIDVSQREEGMVCGYESGHIVLWGLMRTEMLKTIIPTEKSPILAIKFWKETRNSIIASNARGAVSIYNLTYYFFQWTVEKKVLIDVAEQEKKMQREGRTDPLGHLPGGFFSIEILTRELTRHHKLNKYTLVALVSMRMVLIVSLDPVVSIVYRYNRPEGLSDLSIPSASWGRGALPSKFSFS